VVVVLVLFVFAYVGQACTGTPFTCSNPTTSQDRRPNKSALTIATFNAEWLFWSNGNNGPSNKCPADHSGGICPWANADEANDHLSKVAGLLSQVNADIIALQEVQDCVVLQCLIDEIGDNTYKPYLIRGTDTATDQNVAIISRVDPISALFRDESRATINREDSTCGSLPDPTYTSGVSKHFIARFNVNGIGSISLIGAHLLANPTIPDRCIRREAQATVLSWMAENERTQGRQVIILGDLNDYDADILDASNSVPTSRVSQILKFSQGSRIMFNMAEKISSRPERYSSWWDKDDDCVIEPGELTLIDHILVSTPLYSRTSVTIFNGLNDICDLLESDHYPIKITITGLNNFNESIIQDS